MIDCIKNYYTILQVEKTASSATISRAYREKSREAHPDTNSNSNTKVQILFRIQEAYEVLKNSKTKAEYDRCYIPPHKYSHKMLINAASNDDHELMDHLLEHGNLNIHVAFHEATIQSNIKAMENLITSGVDINVMHSNTEESFLHKAIATAMYPTHKYNTINTLIKYKINLDSVNKHGNTALNDAIYFRDTDSVIQLLAAGANTKKAQKVEVVEKFKNNPLEFILNYNFDQVAAINAIDNIEKQTHLGKASRYLHYNKECLNELDPNTVYTDLNELCGENGSQLTDSYSNTYIWVSELFFG